MSLQNINNSDCRISIETDVQQLVEQSYKAFEQYSRLTISERRGVLNAIREKLIPFTSQLARQELTETCMGNVEDKIVKIALAIEKTPGVEDLNTEILTGDDGMTLYEYSAYGLACALQPSTNPCATLISNAISMLAAGNSLISIPHPRCVESSKFVVEIIDDAIYSFCGIRNLVSTVDSVSNSITSEIMNHPDVSLVIATGSDNKVRRALGCGKRVVAAGAANPVVIVDETSDIESAAKDIVRGASFDNGIMCLSENNIVVVDAVADKLCEALAAENVYLVKDTEEMVRLTKATINDRMEVNRLLIGKSASEILDASNIKAGTGSRLIVVDTVKSHPFAMCEMPMPLIPLIRVSNFDKAIETALFIEQGYKHSAYIHSQSISRLNIAAHKMQTSVFVKNGSSLIALGLSGDGKTSFTIANVTGEGLVTARDLTRKRRCTLMGAFTIR